MAALRPPVSLRTGGRGSNGVVIKEGMRPLSRVLVVEGKGKKVIVEDEAILRKEELVMPGTLNLDFLKSGDDSLKGCESFKIVGMNKDRVSCLKSKNGQERDAVFDYVKDSGRDSRIEGMVTDTNKQEILNEVGNAWTKAKHIKIEWNREKIELSDDGVAVMLNSEMEEKKKHVLRHSVVIKVLGSNVSFPMCILELRKQWSKYGRFHLTSIGMDWILRSFRMEEAVEEILNGGLWFIGEHIVGIDRWTPAFDPYSFKGVTAPIWIRFLYLPLYCWDEDNIARIASRFGTPMYIDGNTFRWRKREFARVCVKIDLEKKLPNGVWVEGSAGRFFQRVEYEKVDLFCYHCGRVGHNKTECPEKVVQGITDQAISKSVADESSKTFPEANSGMIKSEYGPWIHINKMDNMGSKPVQNVNPAEMKKVDNPIAVSNRFDALLDDYGDEPVKNNEDVDKSKALVTQCTEETNGVGNNVVKLNDVDLKHAGLGSQSGSTKVKLAKELRSLGPLETGYKKKRRDGRREAALYLKELVREQDVCFFGLLETKMTCIGRREVDYLIGNDWDFYYIPAVGLSGGMLVLWDKKIVSFVVKVTSSQVILGDLLTPSMGLWKIATVYGSRCSKEREDLWRQLEEGLKEHNPSIIGGDFNCILNKEEKRGGKRFVFSKGPKEMKQFMTNSDFHDVRSVGPRHLARVASDHSLIAFKLDEKIQFNRMNIKFEDTWRTYPAARSIVYHSWKKNDFGDHSEILQRKTSRTMKALFFWSKSKFKNLKTLKEELKKDIIKLQNKEIVGINWTNEDLLLLRSKVHELNVTLNWLATWWNQRAKARWHEEGDNNSKMFHNFASARRNGNRVVQIRDVNNISQVEDDEIEKKLSQGVVAELCSEFTLAVGYPIKKKVIRLFGYKNVKEMSYLGIKLSLNRLKLADFHDMLSNVMDKLNTWGKKTLSLGGSERVAENLVMDKACVRGCNNIESYEHIMELRRMSTRNLGIVKVYCTIIYLSWRNRNCVKHGKSALPSSVIASNALALASNKDSPYLSNQGTNLLRESCESWCPPPKDWMKINVDAALLRSNCAGVVGIFRDHKGRFILAFGEKKIHWDISKLEM
ncbi:hypothetical protein KFK09_028322 [Dendrobium nobile]|uniref:CCHC-type domain-containing protein n=1 Tax=Dendrobium nobile TaxID=94219 RepID=A0A8T3A325_DENNO|nr:hypothetical protein KFK09_028322 [Dendrobium nobile]